MSRLAGLNDILGSEKLETRFTDLSFQRALGALLSVIDTIQSWHYTYVPKLSQA